MTLTPDEARGIFDSLSEDIVGRHKIDGEALGTILDAGKALVAEVEQLREWQRIAVALLTDCECYDPASVMGDQFALLLSAAKPQPEAVSHGLV